MLTLPRRLVYSLHVWSTLSEFVQLWAKEKFQSEEKMQFLLEKNLIFTGIKFREFREFTHFRNFRENQISLFFGKLAKFAKINSLKVKKYILR